MASTARALVLAASAIVVVAGVLNIRDHQRKNREIDGLRRGINLARMAADSCRGSLDYQQERFQAFGAHVDSLRQEVRDFESLDPRGVPEARYEEYLARFEAYNDSVAAWDRRVEVLRDGEAACRLLVERHNVLSDSLRRRLLEEGVDLEGGG